MAPSLLAVGTAALACVGSAAAKQWYLQDSYDASNFFDKFDFVTESESSFAHYQNKKDAFDLGLAQYNGDEVYVGVDHKTILEQGEGFAGRPSVRIESKAQFNHGLFIARFSHLPESKCGTWPGFFTFGAPWPTAGGINIYSGSHESPINQPSLHTGNSKDLGVCRLDGEGQTAPVSTENCDNTFSNAPLQVSGQGCAASEHDGPFATPEGGVYAVEWTNKFIKLYSWKWNNVPANLDSEEPNTDSWGAPSVWLKNQNCEIDDHFVNQRLALSIDLCGANAWTDSCQASTGAATCADYVSSKPADFANSYFKIKDIRYFKGVRPLTKTTSFAEIETEAPIAELRRGIVDPHTTSSFATGGSTTSSHGPFTNSSTTVSHSSTSSASTTLTSSSSESSSTGSQTGSSSTGSETGSSSTGSQTGSSSTGSQTGSSSTGTQTGSSSTGTQTGSSSTGSQTGSSSTGTQTGSSSTGTQTGSSSTGSQTGSSSTGSQTGSSSTGTQTGSSSTGSETGSVSTTKTGSETGSVSTTKTGSETGSVSTTKTGSETGSVSTTKTGSETGSVSTTKTGSETGSVSTTKTGSETGSVSTTKTGGEPGSSTTKTGSETGPVSTTKTGSETGSASTTKTGGEPGSSTTKTGSQTGPITTLTSTVELTTSTVYTTITETITKCPAGHPCTGVVVTKTVPWYTTVCPVTATPTGGPETITETITTVYTITSCPPEVTDCPVGKVITKYITTTYCPGNEKPTAPGGGPAEHTGVPHEGGSPNGPATVTKGYAPPPAFTPEGKTKTVYQTIGGGSKPSGFETVPASAPNGATPTKGTECNGENCPEVVTAGAAKIGASVAVVFGAIIAMMI